MPGPVLIANGNLRVRACRYGLMTYMVNDRYVGGSFERYGEYSEGEVHLFRQIVRPGHVVVEAGANIGAHTLPLAKLAGAKGSVLAFEPQRQIFQILCANLALNRIGNVRAMPMALGARPGQAVIPPVDYGTAENFGGVALAAQGEGESVPVLTLDSTILPACHLIKADVEGMEIDVIDGAVATIGKFRPTLYVENDRRKHSPVLIKKLFDLGYRLYWHLPLLFNPANFFEVAENVFGTIGSINVLGIPKERNPTITGMREIVSPDDWWKVTPAG